MKWLERSITGKTFRPRPVIHQNPESQLFMAATSWSSAESAQKIITETEKYILAAKGDVEVTSPFDFLSCYSSAVNSLRVAALIANEQLYRQENKTTYNSLVEFVALYKNGNQLSWLQSGQPQIFLKRKNENMSPLSICYQDDQHLSQTDQSALPLVGLGLENNCPFQVGECTLQDQDQILLLSGSVWPSELMSHVMAELQFDEVARFLSRQYQDQAFWFCIVDLENLP